jgi:exonuclease III
MKILYWNILHGGRKRLNGIKQFIKSVDEIDVVILREYRNNLKGKVFLEFLQEEGFHALKIITNSKNR